MSIAILITRHGKKEKKEVVAGSNEDKKVDLSPEGKVECYELGKKVISAYPHYSHIHAATSDFLRTKRTAEKLLEGSNYRINDSGLVTLVQKPSLGFGGIDWASKLLPQYSEEGQAGDDFRIALLTDFYRPTKGKPNLPVMARFAYGVLDAVIEGVEGEVKRKGQKLVYDGIFDPMIEAIKEKVEGKGHSLVLVATHAPIIDAAANHLYGSLIVGDNGETRVENFPGFFRMGEFITGYVDSGLNGPSVVFNIKGKEKPYSLSQLKEMRDMHKRFAGQ